MKFSMRTVAALGKVEDINTWSNIPYFFYKTGQRLGYFHSGWNLDLSRYRWSRTVWNLKEMLQLKGKGGFQYSDYFLNQIEKQIDQNFFQSEVITFNQHFPRYKSIDQAGGKLFHYIDAPFKSLIESNYYRLSLSEQKAKKALVLEKENYKGSRAIVTMASWAAKVLENEYNIDPDKTHTIMAGANINVPEDYVFKPFNPGAGIKRDLRLGFIGKDWKRKGLDLVFEIANILSERGYKISIEVIGNAPKNMIDDPNVNYHGFVNKHTEQHRFIDIVASCDLGCVFSLDEAFGISTLEFLRLGVPVTGFLDKGLKDTIPSDAGIGFKTSIPINEIAEKIEAYIKNEDQQKAFQQNAQKWSEYVTWERCVKEWKEKVFHE